MQRVLNTIAVILVCGVLAARGAAPSGGDPVLEALIRDALDGNPSVQAAESRCAAAAAASAQARAAFLPMLKASGTWARTDNAPQAFMMTLNQRALSFDGDFNQPDPTENLRVGLEARYRLFDAGRRGLDHDAAELAAGAAGAQLQAARNTLIHEVTRAYYGVLQAQSMTAVQSDAVASLATSLGAANARLAAGSVVKSDVLNLEVRLAEAREDLLRASNGVALAAAALNTALGRDIGTPLALHAPPDWSPQPPPDEDLAAVAGRPELLAAQGAAAALRQLATRARRDALPAVNAFGSMDWDSDVSADFEQSYLVGVMAEWDLFAGGLHLNAARAARAQWRGAEALAADARDKLLLDLKSAHLGAAEAWGRLGIVGKSLASAEESLRITRARYEQGAAEVTDLLTAEVGLSATRMRAVVARYDYLVALSNVQRARGDLARRHADGGAGAAGAGE